MTELQVYAGITLAGAMASQVTPALVRLHHRLERELGDMPRWADALALAGSWVAGIGAGLLAGAVLGHESDALGHSWRIGAVWGCLGGVVGPTVWPSVWRLGLDAAKRRVGAGQPATSQEPPADADTD